MKNVFLAAPLICLFLSLNANSHRVAGVVESLDYENNQYTIKENGTGKLHTFKFKDNTSVRDQGKTLRKLSALSVGDDVIYKRKTPKRPVTLLKATITGIDYDAKKVRFIDEESGKEKTFTFDPSIKHDGRKVDFQKLRPGQTLVLELEKAKRMQSASRH